jgi:signal transduction histidine kinase
LASAVACAVLPVGTARAAIAVVLAVEAVAICRLFVLERFRPLDEHLLDLALVVAAIGAAAGIGVLVRAGAAWTRMPSPDTSATMAAVLTAAAAAPAALWMRSAALARRYGAGAIAPADVVVITASLGAKADPRDLLEKAARMVAAASGCRDARLVLGEEPPEVSSAWVVYPLDVGGQRVGSLAVEGAGAEGLEPRQADDVARLVPTVALVAHAVTLAVEAELTRRDVSRERDLERRRILADLHDGLGPVLAGMSMRVRAALRAHASGADAGLLEDLADGLATSRTDLRRIVAGITPSALEDGDLTAALERLVASFRSPGPDGPALSLTVATSGELGRDVEIAVYRCVAEGLTNALRHAGATRIAVSVVSTGDSVSVEVVDDGVGGPVVPGVGLSSLRARAEALGGRLVVADQPSQGTALRLALPCPVRVPA